MTVDDYGRVILEVDEVIDLLYSGNDISSDILVKADAEIIEYNSHCRLNDKAAFSLSVDEPKDRSAQAEHLDRQSTWFLPLSMKDYPLWEKLAERCKTVEETSRLDRERAEYQKRGLDNLLKMMVFLVDDFRRRNIVWGVGRGSSVASFVLYLIGINKINPLKYGLDISEFLKD